MQTGYLVDVIDRLLCARDIRTSVPVALEEIDAFPMSDALSPHSSRWCFKDNILEYLFVTLNIRVFDRK